ncbi:phytoene synthase, putative [Babesia ovis]|uniref:Phytoene synthase, putative n=1 Tax=Babesia ovis TaxID=5869 RepID=A0A9W5T9I6_BABOV|nr:phytoene synthase, putative [Babesia ovis]
METQCSSSVRLMLLWASALVLCAFGYSTVDRRGSIPLRGEKIPPSFHLRAFLGVPTTGSGYLHVRITPSCLACSDNDGCPDDTKQLNVEITTTQEPSSVEIADLPTEAIDTPVHSNNNDGFYQRPHIGERHLDGIGTTTGVGDEGSSVSTGAETVDNHIDSTPYFNTDCFERGSNIYYAKALPQKHVDATHVSNLVTNFVENSKTYAQRPQQFRNKFVPFDRPHISMDNPDSLLSPEGQPRDYPLSTDKNPLYKTVRKTDTCEANLDDMVENAFIYDPQPEHLCIMGCQGQDKSALLSKIVTRLSAHKRKKRHAPHILYVVRSGHEINILNDKHGSFWSALGSVNLITTGGIALKPTNLMTLADMETLIGVYNTMNNPECSDAGSIVTHLKQLFDRLPPVDPTGDAAPCEDVPRESSERKLTLKFNDILLNDTNTEPFVSTLKTLITSFLRSHDDVANRDWTVGVFPPQKEAMLSQYKWQESSYQTPEELAERLKIDERGKRIMLVDGLAYDYKTTRNRWLTGTFDFVMSTLLPECQLVAISPRTFNPQNLAQWIRRSIGPIEFVLGRKFPEIRVFYDKWDFNPFEDMRPFRYAKADVAMMREALSGSVSDLQAVFQKNIRHLFPVNYPVNIQFQSMIKQILKDLMADAGIDTMHKLKHRSRNAFDYVKQYLPGGSAYRRPRKSKNTEPEDLNDPASIDAFLDQLISLEAHRFGARLVPLLQLSTVVHKRARHYAGEIVDHAIKDGLYPTIIYAGGKHDLHSYYPVLMDRFDVIPDLETRLQECEIGADIGEYLKRGVACLHGKTHRNVVSFVLKNIDLFKVIVTNSSILGGKHYICHFTNDKDRSDRDDVVRSKFTVGNSCLGAERISFWAIPHTIILRELMTLLSPMRVDFRWLDPGEMLNNWRRGTPREIGLNPRLAQSMERGTFAKFMEEHGNRFAMKPTNLSPDRAYDSRKPSSSCDLPPYRGAGPRNTPVVEPLTDEIAADNLRHSFESYRGTTPGSQEALDDNLLAVGQTTGFSPPGMLERPWSVQPGHDHPDIPIRSPHITNMLERQIHLEALEGALRLAGVDMEPFYRLDQKKKSALRYEEYVRAHIYGMLLHKQKDIYTIHGAIGLHGAEIIGLDNQEYTMVWMGRPREFLLPHHSVFEPILVNIHRLFEEHGQNQVFTVLKGDKGYLCISAIFIKDISALPTRGARIEGKIRNMLRQKISVQMEDGIPDGSLPNELHYFSLSEGVTPDFQLCPETLQSSAFLPPRTQTMISAGLEMKRHYGALETEMTNDAIDKILATPSVGPKTSSEAFQLLMTVRSIYRNRALGGLERYLTERDATSLTWGRRSGSPSQVFQPYNSLFHSSPGTYNFM